MAVKLEHMMQDLRRTEAFLVRLGQLGVRIRTRDGKLLCQGPGDLLRGPLGVEIRANRSQLLAYLDESKQQPPTPALPRAKGLPELSPAQLRLWVAEQIDPGTAHHIPFVLEARGALDIEKISAVLRLVTQRHDVLRLRINDRGGQPVARIAQTGDVLIREINCKQAQLDKIIAQEISLPFNLQRQPPIRLSVLRGEPDILVLTLHHIAADGTSIEILMRDFAALYSGADLPELSRQYVDYAAWQNSPVVTQKIADQSWFWRETLAALPITRLPTDAPRPARQDMAGALHPIALPADLVERLRQLGARHGASLYSVLFGAFSLLVSRYTSERDLVIGTPMANRPAPETADMIGLFVNILPVRCQIDPEANFAQVLSHVHQRLLQVMEHQDVPFDRLIEIADAVRDPTASPLFQIKFQLDRAVNQSLDLPGLSLIRLARRPGLARHDLSLDLVESTSGVSGHFDYATALFKPETITRLARHYEQLLHSIAEADDKPVILLDILTSEDANCECEIWNQSQFPLDPTERFPDLFEAQVIDRPDAIATEFHSAQGSRTETYSALNIRANRLAHWLRAQGCGPGKVVGISMRRGLDLAAAWLGVLKSGAAYLPLDPDYPADRLAYMLDDSGARLVLTETGLPLPKAVQRVNLDADWPDGATTNPTHNTNPQDLAYVIYTSGSTGHPKGVDVPHEGLVNLTHDKIRKLGIEAGDRVLSVFSFSFDAHVPDFVMSLGAGGRLIFAPSEDILPGAGLAKVLRETRTTHLTITPSALSTTPEENLPNLRCVLVGGEAPAPELIDRWSRGRLFVNGYGPTETTVNASMVPCGGDHSRIPALLPPANKQLYVLGQYMELLPVGCPGELYIGGTGLARGYRGRPAQTAAAFVPNPFNDGERLYRSGDAAMRMADGRIRLLGRIDDQVKLRGYRIEPSEIARVIGAFEAVESTQCGLRDLGGKPRLIGWYVGADVDEGALGRHLKTRLPRHMWPDHLICVPTMPLTVNGKADVKALPDPQIGDAASRPPEGPVEEALAEIYADILGIETPGAEDDFFDLGGTSLLATMLVTRIEDRLGYRLRVMHLFGASSIADLALRIGGEHHTPCDPWENDLPLDPAIRPAHARTGDAVLLTGATGFVGKHLLAGLLSAGEEKVLCLLRDGDAGRLQNILEQAGLWQTDFAGRIEPVTWDLAAGDPGLADAGRAALTGIGTIFHCAAQVHHASPYKHLRAANVRGTDALIRLACDTGAALHYISTLSALTPRESQITETDAARDFDAPQGGYNQSKWVAEQLVAQAAERGLPVTIHRLGSVGAAISGGPLNLDDILVRQLRGYLDLGRAPQGDALINILPVDYVVQAILHAAQMDANGQVLHLTHSRAVPTDLLFEACAAEGCPVSRISTQDWQTEMHRIARGSPDHPLYALAGLGGAHGFTGALWPYSAKQTRKLLAKIPEPPLNNTLLRSYVRRLLKEPDPCRAT